MGCVGGVYVRESGVCMGWGAWGEGVWCVCERECGMCVVCVMCVRVDVCVVCV